MRDGAVLDERIFEIVSLTLAIALRAEKQWLTRVNIRESKDTSIICSYETFSFLLCSEGVAGMSP